MLGRFAANEFQSYASLASEELRDAAALQAELGAAIAAVNTERDDLADVLAKVYLPELTEPALLEAERRTGFRGFSTRRPLDALAKEEKKLAARVTSLEADERWQKREHLTGPHGAYTRALAEAKDLLDPWERDCARFEELDQFLELVTLRYDTPEFEERWWQPIYWRHWAAGDKICAALGLDDFGDDVLPAYEAAKVPRDKWRAEVARIQQDIDGVHEHVREHDRVAWRLANLASIYLEECQRVLAKHLVRADVPLLAAWAGDDRGVTVHLKRLSGLTAKVEMLQEMMSGWLKPTHDALASAQQRYALKAIKLSRPKKASIEVVLPEGVPEKLAAQRARREKARSYVQRIVRYDGYDRFDLAQPPETWWLHMHDNRRPGLFTPGLRTWYDRHPDIVVVADPRWEADRGDALAATGAMAALGDIS
ncbi:MAG: hypothetical protein Q8P18_21110 [Pseudomonadota bacterium]|nr:hypothetical protein [Pseudomonadota bacterium]